MQLVFVDTEFTSFEAPKLISIGLVTLNKEEFYAEVEYDLHACSDFVRKTVVPLLSEAQRCSLVELKVRLSEWIEKIKNPGPALLHYDSEYDRLMLESIFENDFPNAVFLHRLGTSYIDKIRQYEYHVKTKQVEHHALHDARALRYAFRAAERKSRLNPKI
jgi:DNA polymerase III epsilon subunit-like protein